MGEAGVRVRARARARAAVVFVSVRGEHACGCGVRVRARACGRDVCARADRGLVRGICPGLVGPHVVLAHIDRGSFRGGRSGLMERMNIHGD